MSPFRRLCFYVYCIRIDVNPDAGAAVRGPSLARPAACRSARIERLQDRHEQDQADPLGERRGEHEREDQCDATGAGEAENPYLAFLEAVVEVVTNSYMNAETIRVDGGIRMQPK